jgi:hypothetical protein
MPSRRKTTSIVPPSSDPGVPDQGFLLEQQD